MADVPVPSFHPAPSKPRLALPPGACDTHVHVFGPAAVFPYAPERPFTPADAPKERLFALHALLGIERCVMVQSTCHGFDNSAIADAIAAKNGDYCGVALAPATADIAALRRLDAQGFRAVRFNFSKHLGARTPIADVIAMTPRLQEIGWHLQVHFDSSLIDELAPHLARSAVTVVVDHMGRVDASQGFDQPAFRTLRTLLRNESVWVKVSGCDRISQMGPPYADAVPFARALVAEFGERTVWGTDWPHPNHNHVPDDGALVDLLAQIAPSEGMRQMLLVDNPQRLYGFPVRLAKDRE
jgi:2-pyrone-4,6-dicarboxylate lactonase